MDFALCPDKGPPRLIRFVSNAELQHDNIVSYLDRKNNLLMVNLSLYERLNSLKRQVVIKTHAEVLLLQDIESYTSVSFGGI